MGEAIVRGSVWFALLCYPAGPWAVALRSPGARRTARVVWALGCLAFIVHTISSFAVFYDWSHRVALTETARQVEELTGTASGGGLYLNYLFGLLWCVDVVRRLRAGGDSDVRPRWPWLLFHGFFLFMIFNATVVFEDGATRVMGGAVTLAGVAGVVQALRRSRGSA